MIKKIIIIVIVGILLTSCGVTIKSVADKSITEPYQKPFIVIPYEKYSTKNFSKKLKEKIEIEFQNDNRSVNIYIFEKQNKGLSLNANNEVDKKINETILNGKIDLLLIFKPTHLQYTNGGLQSVTYELVGIDTKTKKEVWKAEFSSSGGFGPAMFAEKSAKIIYEKLKTDKIL